MATYTSGRWDRLLSMAEQNGTFSLPFIEKVQQASSDDRILHGLRQYAPHSLHQQLLSFAAVAIIYWNLEATVAHHVFK
jgi:hypothetical protein